MDCESRQLLERWRDSNYSDECLKTIFLNYVDKETFDRIDNIEQIERIWGVMSFILYLKGNETLEDDENKLEKELENE